MKNLVFPERLMQNFNKDRIETICLLCVTTVLVFLSNSFFGWDPFQRIWCMGYAESLANSTPFSVYAETITVSPSPIAFGLPHVYLMSFLIRAGINAYHAYIAVLFFWVVLSVFSCYKICRFLKLDPDLSAVLPLFLLTLPAIARHQAYTALGIGFMLLPFYAWAAILLFKASSPKEKILSASLFLPTAIVALFMDGYSFVMAAVLTGGIYLVFFSRKNWKMHLFCDTAIMFVSYLAAYVLYTAFVGKQWESLARLVFNLYQAHFVSYFLPPNSSLSVLADLFPYRPPFFPNGYPQDFLFCTPLLIADLLLLFVNWKQLYNRWQYWLLWGIILCSVWLSLGPDIFLLSGKTIPSGNWFVYRYLPGFSVMRATARWGILVHVLLVAMLYVSLINSKMSRTHLTVLLCVLYMLNYFPSSKSIGSAKYLMSMERKIRDCMVPDLDKKLVPGETVLFLPIRNNFSHLYFGSLYKVNTWNTGCDKNAALLREAYPPEIQLLADHINLGKYISHLDSATAIQIFMILRNTNVDVVVFDYNCVAPLPVYPYKNLLKKDAVVIEKELKRFGCIMIDHSKYFAYYRLKKTADSKPDRKSKNLWDILPLFAYRLNRLPCVINMNQLSQFSFGFFPPENKGSWAINKKALAARPPEEAGTDGDPLFGFFPPDKKGLWATNKAAFAIRLPEKAGTDGDFFVRITLRPYIKNDKPQRCRIYSRGKLIRQGVIDSLQVVSIPVTGELIDADRIIQLEFEFPDAARPVESYKIRSCFFHNVEISRKIGKIDLNKLISAGDIKHLFKGPSVPGFSGFWTGNQCSFRLPIAAPGKIKRNLLFAFQGRPSLEGQSVKVRDSRQKVLGELKLSKSGWYYVEIPAESISDDNVLALHLEFPDAGKAEGDRAAFFFNTIKLVQATNVAPADRVLFNSRNDICRDGFSSPEGWGSWSEKKSCFMLFALPPDRKSENVHLQFTCQAYKKMKSVKIYCNGNYAAVWDVRKYSPDVYDLKLRVPLSVQNVVLRFEQFNVASPWEIAGSPDLRTLGLGFISMKYLPATN